VPRGRHSLVPITVRSRRFAMVTAPLATALVIGAGIAAHDLHVATPMANQPAAAAESVSTIGLAGDRVSRDIAVERRTVGTSRSTERTPLVPAPRATGRMWTTAPLDLRVFPRAKGPTAGTVKADQHVAVTGRHRGAFAEVISGRTTHWVTTKYLSEKKKVAQPGSQGLVDRSCPGTEGTESGLTPSAVKVYRAVCNNFPQITTYGGYDAHGEHASGRAIDIMTSDVGLGNQIAAFLQANAGALNLYDVIWQQHIWTPVRAGEGWRSMPDRGSSTANHYDHVHVSVN
jgi:hypothetical protein